ncbi:MULTISPECIES: SDR family NAD(P)-dependent oxidoreductase [Vibrio diabolicus subgroup]|uniref:SDR family NAD(P)-dependent oxidoreductase n=1 Tax=Vibrio diabolicus subgroup TaxID=2315253 RepID=UPI00080F37CD|nr:MULTISPECIES: SDR family NAD(P)-dependent oxidoreductase [Vibrio diabolicus subgroup]EHR5764779.1 SDR family NAD(P)-dependent oxidoreductase [Vibrio parahaemolyticus]EHY0932701.1 SDR family NAD(P)-dependent oxidoreductase [Vibrio parahaemolyticus]EIZ0312356.1 SDR family NAD(P)-dependent oxidoreductase [Vibrio parahaemolyticus]EJE8515925.1 SDR family NAD(P)-dependent oxidoreductase [Vibrio parahaemolyticus]EJE8774721.1 SDR family NAD(P)-dependent oxidoreductase [Vibrio parahaemolyticus]
MTKYALITGGSRGIGRSIAEYFVRQGYSLILVSRDIKSLKNAKSRIESKYENSHVSTIPVDFSRPDEVESAFKSILSRYQHIDVMVNSAGILIGGSTGLSIDDLSKLINTNLFSNFIVCNIIAEHMKKNGSGEIYTLGSIAGLEPVPKIAAYSATKAAVVSYSQSLYYDLMPFNIKVCCLCPSVVDTDMTNDGRIDNNLKIDPDDLHKAISFFRCLSPGASIPIFPIRCAIIDSERV